MELATQELQRAGLVTPDDKATIAEISSPQGDTHDGSTVKSACVMIPTLHLNGTSGEVLRHQHRTAIEALRRALDALCEAAPNGRDYYVQGDEAGRKAQRKHEARVASLRRVRAELETITRGIEVQLDARNAQKRP